MKICYCFDYTERDIIEDVVKNKGGSTILDRIREAKRVGGCRCAERNPSGR